MHRVVVSGLALVPLAVACSRAPQAAPPPLEVGTAPVVQRDVPIVTEWIGTLDGSVNADIRPKVEGYLLRQLYKEGRSSAAGQPLFEIDPRQFRASVEQARGALGQAEAQLAKTENDVERFTPLAAERAISQQELDNALSAERNAQAAVASARAAVDQSALNLGWTRVTSPIEGIAGIAPRAGRRPGERADGDDDGLHGRPHPRHLRHQRARVPALRRQHQPRGLRDDASGAPRWSWCSADGSVFPEKGKAVLVDREVDPRTGHHDGARASSRTRATSCGPASTRKVRAALETRAGALLVPQRAVIELQGGYRVGVVGADGKAELRAVTPGAQVDGLWVIEQGAEAGRERDRDGPAVRACGHRGEGEASRAGRARQPGSALGMSRFFVDRPIVAIVISILTVCWAWWPRAACPSRSSPRSSRPRSSCRPPTRAPTRSPSSSRWRRRSSSR